MPKYVSEDKTLLDSWDFKANNIKPSEAIIKSGNKYYWTCKEGHSYIQDVYSKLKGTGCPYCSGKIAVKGVNDLKTLHPELEKEWDYEKNIKNNYDIDTIPIGSQKKVWWICPNGHSYSRSIYDRLHGRGNCNYCSHHELLEGFNDVATTNPELLKEWDYEKNNKIGIYPNKIMNGSRIKVWWKCERGHEWDAIIRSRFTGHGCPYCSNNKVLKGYNDITTTNPELLPFWNYEKNGSLQPEMISHGSTKKVWWKCEKGHEYLQKVAEMSKGNRCPYCSNNRVLKGENDFLTRYPELEKEWDYEKNNELGIFPDSIIKGGKVKVWWKCERGHEWESTVASRIRGDNLFHACPVCSSYRRTSLPEKIIYYYLKKTFDDTIASYKPDCLMVKK